MLMPRWRVTNGIGVEVGSGVDVGGKGVSVGGRAVEVTVGGIGSVVAGVQAESIARKKKNITSFMFDLILDSV